MAHPTHPLVTVILPVYNAEAYLAEAIGSILNQTFSDLELLIINDGSTDGSVDVINSFKDERIRLVHNDANLKLIATLNKGIELARGKYMARMDADDVSLSARVQKQVAVMEAHAEIGVCSCWFESFGAGANQVVKYPESHDAIRLMLLYQTALCHAAAMFRMEFLKRINFRYSPQFVHAEDLEIWVRLAPQTKFANVQEVLYKVRMHPASVSAVNEQIQKKHTIEILKMQLEKLGMILSEEEVIIFREIAYSNFKAEKQYITKAEVLLTRLSEANEKKHFINRDTLTDFIFQKWFHLCYNTTSLGAWVYDIFHQSPLSKLGTVPVMHKLKFALKGKFGLL